MTEVVVEEGLLECGICLEMLNETCKMLPCQHTYCKTCLENTRQNEGCLRCPQCRTVIDTDINNLPKNLVLLSLIEQVKKKPPPQPKNDEDELVKAMSISMEEFRKENAPNLLLRHNEQLQTQLALENSKREALLQSEEETSNDCYELLNQVIEEELYDRRVMARYSMKKFGKEKPPNLLLRHNEQQQLQIQLPYKDSIREDLNRYRYEVEISDEYSEVEISDEYNEVEISDEYNELHEQVAEQELFGRRVKAMSISMKEFGKENAPNLLLRHNEQLQTQLALENSKREALLQSEEETSDECNELLEQVAEQELFGRRVKAMSISMKEFGKENAPNLLLRHNEQLQTQLALENSKREALLQSEEETSDECNELLEQVAEQELFGRRVKAMSISMKEFGKENAPNLLLRHNEQLQTQLPLENSKREALLQSEKEISDEYNELLHFQTAFEQSEEQELFRRRNQHLLSEKEKLECQLVLLKSELEANTARSSNNSDMASLFSWFAKNMDKISDDQRREAQKGLESLRRAVGTQFEDDSTLNQLQLLIDKMKKDDIKNDRDQNRPTTSNDNGDAAINDLMKNLNELQTMLREESKDKTTRNNQQRNFLYPVYPPPIPSLLEDQQMFHLRPRFYDPRMPSPQYPPSMLPSFQPPPNYLSKFDGRGGSEARNFYSRGGNNGGHLKGGRNDGGHGRGRSGGSPSKSVFQKMGFDKLQNQRRESGDIPGSIILPDVRDYKKLNKIPDNNFGTKSESGNQKYGDKQTRDYRFPSSNPGIRGPLLLPDIRYYDKIHSKFHKDTETSDNTKCDDESLGSDVKGRHSNFENNNERTPRTPYRGKKPYRGRGKKTFHPRSKSTEKNNGDESDSSVSSLASCSSHLSTASTPSGPSNFRQNKPFRGNKYKQRNSDHHNPQNRFHENTDRKDVFNRNRNSNQKDDIKRLLYPSKQDALRKNIDLNKKFDTPVICLGKDVNKPVSQTVECLADVYEFEEKYQDCKVIRI